MVLTKPPQKKKLTYQYAILQLVNFFRLYLAVVGNIVQGKIETTIRQTCLVESSSITLIHSFAQICIIRSMKFERC